MSLPGKSKTIKVEPIRRTTPAPEPAKQPAEAPVKAPEKVPA
jgi:hypothetical protein